MARKGSINIPITADADGVKRGVRDADRSLDRLNKSASRAGRGLKLGFAAAGAGAVGLAGGLAASAKAAVEAEKSQVKLQAQLRALGISYDQHAEKIDTAIQKQSQLAGIDDEDLQDAFTAIVRTTGDVNKSLDLLAVTSDLARAKQLDVAKAGEIVAKVAGGNTGILARYGIQVEKGASAQEALAALQTKFAGQAAAYGTTTAGAMDRAKVASENLGEIVGSKLTPLLAKAATALVSVVTAVQTAWPKITAVMAPVVEAIRGYLNIAIAAVRSFALKNRADIERVRDAFVNVGRAIRAVITGVIVPVIAAALPGIRAVLNGIVKVVQGMNRVVAGILTGDFAAVWRGLKGMVSGALGAVVGAIRSAAGAIGAAMKLIGRAILSAFKAAAGGVVSAAVSLGRNIVSAIVDGIRGAAGAISGAISGAVKGALGGLSSKAKHLLGFGSRIRAVSGTTLGSARGLTFEEKIGLEEAQEATTGQAQTADKIRLTKARIKQIRKALKNPRMSRDKRAQLISELSQLTGNLRNLTTPSDVAAVTEEPAAVAAAEPPAAAVATANPALEENNRLLAEHNENQRRLLAIAENESNRIIGGLVAAINGDIGARVQQGFASPSYAGALARY